MRRFGAFFLDMILLMLAVLPLLVVLVLGVEYDYTEEWTWTLRREMPRPTDPWPLYGGIAGMLLAIGAYFYRALRLGRPTLGRYIAGYHIAVQHGEPGLGRGRAFEHLVVSSLSLELWPITIVVGWFNDGVHLWDEGTDTRALVVERNAFGDGDTGLLR